MHENKLKLKYEREKKISDFTLLTWDSSHLVDKMSNCNNVCLYMRIQEFSSHHICSNCDLKINKKINRMYQGNHGL